jgi:two-component system cell cycle sensor histidine kinase/response regulator CckA
VKILVVDDEMMIRSLAEKILLKAGFDVITADSGDEGVKKLAADNGHIALVLMDWTMPGMTGIETLKEMRAISHDVPCIISSGHVLEDGAVPEDLEPNTYFLEKPYRSNILLDKVSAVLTE